ncbi:amidohydrolase [Stenotrophomonas sp. ESTM1D_MKCIP4_1]|uniref:carbon-nitrogen hydrolase family protein n=1 Tax=Stenotrophomonas sp. ESTM1D_MKCIP4_1 TaxID=2072414 RepID=UPI000D541EA5|nr:carbon-nitrogen hydrolase family protein [Stenotrophomonas sp. ESTM1D_MKCIP4_1]AWH53623.1 amidohydrolase [Stenotrophomonas sp. ESTM1D_MKCIP4_1]
MIRFAASQYAIELIEQWDDYAAHLDAHVAEAAAAGAQLVLLPEYAAMTLTGQLPPAERGDLAASIAGIQPLLPRWLALCAQIAQRHRLWFCPGSAPVLDDDGQYRNRAFLFGPQGLLGHQDKLIMTRFEREEWNIAGGREGLRTFATPLGTLGILICYDTEFPMLARQLAEAGVDLLLAPSCTDTEAGYHRVRIGSQARALENQLPVLVSVTAGMASWSPSVDVNYGRAAMYVPADRGMPANGVLCESERVFTEESRWLIGQIDAAAVSAVRREGQVALYRDWPEQFAVKVQRTA